MTNYISYCHTCSKELTSEQVLTHAKKHKIGSIAESEEICCDCGESIPFSKLQAHKCN